MRLRRVKHVVNYINHIRQRSKDITVTIIRERGGKLYLGKQSLETT